VVSFGVLGPVQIRAGGELVVLPVKPRTLLAVLVLDAGRMASRDRLTAALWPARPPASAESALGNQAMARRHREQALTRYAELGEAIGEVAVGRPHPPLQLTARQQPARCVQLSVREHALLTAYVSGMTLEAAARHVGIRPTTAKTYLRRVRAKYQAIGRPAHTKLELARRVWEEAEVSSERTT
jgi:DNA-binding CsgD family transcriptional regulator